MTTRKHGDPAPTNGTATRLAGLDRDVERVRVSIAELWSRVDTFGRANWGLLISAVLAAIGVGSVVWGFTIVPIHSDLIRLRDTDVLIRQEHVRKDVDAARQGELTAKFENVAQQLLEIKSNLGDLRRDFREIAPPAKLLDQLLQRIERLEGNLTLESRRRVDRSDTGAQPR